MPAAQQSASSVSPRRSGAAVEHFVQDSKIPVIPLSYDTGDSSAALKIITALNPEWTGPGNRIEFVRFTDGITNTLIKATNHREGLSHEELDRDAVLLRAYGHGTDILIDRHRETQNHELLMEVGLAPQLLARFQNGMLYRFIRGAVTHPNDLRRPAIYSAVARNLAQWHVRVPCVAETVHRYPNGTVKGSADTHGSTDSLENGHNDAARLAAIDGIAPGKPVPNVWTVMQKWIFALPTVTVDQRARQAALQEELKRLVAELSQRPGLGKNGVSWPISKNQSYAVLTNNPSGLVARLCPLRSSQWEHHRPAQEQRGCPEPLHRGGCPGCLH